MLKSDKSQACSQTLLLGGSFGLNMDLFGDLFNKLMDLLFRKGGYSAPREPPWLRGPQSEGFHDLCKCPYLLI